MARWMTRVAPFHLPSLQAGLPYGTLEKDQSAMCSLQSLICLHVQKHETLSLHHDVVSSPRHSIFIPHSASFAHVLDSSDGSHRDMSDRVVDAVATRRRK